LLVANGHLRRQKASTCLKQAFVFFLVSAHWVLRNNPQL